MEPWGTNRGESAPMLPSGLHFAQPDRDIPPEMTQVHDATSAALWSRPSRTRFCEVRYRDLSGETILRAQAQERMHARSAQPRLLLDMRPLLPAARAEALTDESTAESFRRVFTTLVDRLPGEPWGRMPAMKERFGISW